MGWRAKRIDVDVDRSKAVEIANAKTILPARYQRTYMLWTYAWLLSLPCALFALFFYKWWAGLLVLVLLTPTLFRAATRYAMQHMIDYAIEDGTFYSYAVENDVIRVREKT